MVVMVVMVMLLTMMVIMAYPLVRFPNPLLTFKSVGESDYISTKM